MTLKLMVMVMQNSCSNNCYDECDYENDNGINASVSQTTVFSGNRM